jgi:hypothetical protein
MLEESIRSKALYVNGIITAKCGILKIIIYGQKYIFFFSDLVNYII